MNNTVAELLLKYKRGQITHTEWQELRQAVLSGEYHDLIHADILAELRAGAPPAVWNEADANAILQHILSTAPEEGSKPPHYLSTSPDEETIIPVHRVHFLRRAWVRYAAALIILLCAGGYGWYRSHPLTPNDLAAYQGPAAIPPAKNGAILTLADGTNIVLDSTANNFVPDPTRNNTVQDSTTSHLIAAQNGARVLLKNGQLVYDPAAATASGTVYNTITTTKGSQFHIVLPDGTKAYLNAASSLRYPTAFTGSERRVQVNGEAWFEVTKNANMPFRVSIDQKVEVEVLGTSFNVNAYKDERSIDATLVEGLIRVTKGDEKVMIWPGQQARVAAHITFVKNADVDKALAWKNGIFNFEDVGLREMMRQLERWYDIDVTYQPNVPDVKFFGKIPRQLPLDTVLAALKGFGLHCEMKADRKLTVMP